MLTASRKAQHAAAVRLQGLRWLHWAEDLRSPIRLRMADEETRGAGILAPVLLVLEAGGGGDGLALPAPAAVGVGGASSSTPTQASPCATHAGGMPDFHCPGCNVYWNARRAHREGRKKSPEFAKRVSLLVQAQDHSAEGMMSPADSGIHPVQAQDDSAEGMMSPAESGIHPPNPRKVNHNKITPDWFWRASPQCMCFSEVWRGHPRFVCRGPRGHR